MTASPTLEELNLVFDEELRRFLTEQREGLAEGLPLIDEIERMVAAGGKRLRPAFCYWGYRAAGGAHRSEIVRAAASLELLHTFAIVHDDIMDRSDVRRGVATTYARHGTDLALLVGDLALVFADAALLGSGFDPSLLARAFESYSRMRREVIAGQFLDVVAASRDVVGVEEARRIAVLKSGRYSIEEPLVIGAHLAGAPEEMAGALASFGAPLGEAFQLRDDLLGTFGDEARIGKPVDSDIREGKRHVLFAYAASHLNEGERDRFIACWGGGAALSPEEVEDLRALLESSGARAHTEDLLERLREEAFAALGAMYLPAEARRALEDLARRATDRIL